MSYTKSETKYKIKPQWCDFEASIIRITKSNEKKSEKFYSIPHLGGEVFVLLTYYSVMSKRLLLIFV